jgi:myo-inositol-1(or 4)-monophosphatase
MTKAEISRCQKTAVEAARAVGELMRRNLASTSKSVDLETQHDIKLELDSRSQRLIERTLLREHPEIAVLGEEGTVGDIGAVSRWVVDPIDGTVNFAYGLPHACVSIALQRRIHPRKPRLAREYPDLNYETVAGVIYDPFQDELWTAVRGQTARLNGRKISVSSRGRLDQSIVAMGFAKYASTLNAMLPVFNLLIYKVRKTRLLGAAALSMTYVATGRLDAYLEPGIRLWDIAAGGLIIECAGGEFWSRPIPGEHTYEILVSNGKLRGALERVKRQAKK